VGVRVKVGRGYTLSYYAGKYFREVAAVPKRIKSTENPETILQVFKNNQP
jgi:hypothetical protein